MKCAPYFFSICSRNTLFLTIRSHFMTKVKIFLGICGTGHVKTTPFDKKWVFLKDSGLTLLQEHVQACFI